LDCPTQKPFGGLCGTSNIGRSFCSTRTHVFEPSSREFQVVKPSTLSSITGSMATFRTRRNTVRSCGVPYVNENGSLTHLNMELTMPQFESVRIGFRRRLNDADNVNEALDQAPSQQFPPEDDYEYTAERFAAILDRLAVDPVEPS